MYHPYIIALYHGIFCRFEKSMEFGIDELTRAIIIYVNAIVGAGYDTRAGPVGSKRLKKPKPGGGSQCGAGIIMDDVCAIIAPYQELVVHYGKTPYKAIAVVNRVEIPLEPVELVVWLYRYAIQSDARPDV